MPTYEAVAEFAQTWGPVYFAVIFALVLLYALLALAASAIR